MRIENEILMALDLHRPCIWIKTIEEADFLSQFLKLIIRKTTCNNLYSWSLGSGMIKLALREDEEDNIVNASPAIEPLFMHIKNTIEKSKDDNAIKTIEMFILKDFHFVSDKPNVIRGIRDIFENFRGKNKCYTPLIVISPVLNIPQELEHLFTVIEYTTPNEIDIKTILNAASNKLVSKGLMPLTPQQTSDLLQAFKGFTLREITETIATSVKKNNTIKLEEVMEKKVSLIKKTGILEYRKPSTSFDDVAGNESFKNWVEEVQACMTPEARSFGIARPKGYLALGVPGTAKSVMAEAMASKFKMPLIKFNISSIMSKFVGDSERNISKALSLVKACAPCVLYIDEVEKCLAGYNGSQQGGDSGALARVMGALLEFMADNKDGVFTIMTSNDVTKLPPELTRAGRLDAIWYFSLPTEDERKAIFKVHLDKVNKTITEEELEMISKETNDYTGAEIEQIVKSSLRKAFLNKVKNKGTGQITIEELRESKKLVVPISKSSQEKIQFLESWAKGRALYANNESRESQVIFNDDDFELEL
jgi:SpoVK/Ycf46/Vps4 family AAA+-type ATPase